MLSFHPSLIPIDLKLLPFPLPLSPFPLNIRLPPHFPLLTNNTQIIPPLPVPKTLPNLTLRVRLLNPRISLRRIIHKLMVDHLETLKAYLRGFHLTVEPVLIVDYGLEIAYVLA